MDIYDPSESGVELLCSYLSLTKAKSTGVRLHRMSLDHILTVLKKAEGLANPTMRARVIAKARYLARVRNVKSTAQQFLKFEQIPGVQKVTLNGGLRRVVDESRMSSAQKQFVKDRMNVVMSAERTYHRRGRTHRQCAKEFDVTRASAERSFAGWKARRSDEVVLVDRSLDVPRIVERKDVAKSYRREVSRIADNLGIPNEARNEMMKVVGAVVHWSSELVQTAESQAYCEAFEEVTEKHVLVGLDRNTKSAAVMSEATYRAGMADTYAADTEHYRVITDEEKAKSELAEVEKKIWDKLPVWMMKRKLTIGYEYLNLKEK